MKLIITESQYKKLTFDDIVKEAEKYNSKTEFRNGNVTAYNLAIKLGVLSELFPERKQREPKWNYETISQEAKKYKGRRDFSVNNPTAYGMPVNLIYLTIYLVKNYINFGLMMN
jgi:hypothetical protein